MPLKVNSLFSPGKLIRPKTVSPNNKAAGGVQLISPVA